MLISLQQVLEEGAGCCQDHLVYLNLLAILTDQSHISKVPFLPETFKGDTGVFFEIVTFDEELPCHCACLASILFGPLLVSVYSLYKYFFWLLFFFF